MEQLWSSGKSCSNASTSSSATSRQVSSLNRNSSSISLHMSPKVSLPTRAIVLNEGAADTDSTSKAVELVRTSDFISGGVAFTFVMADRSKLRGLLGDLLAT